MNKTRKAVLILFILYKSVVPSFAADPALDRVRAEFPAAMSRLEAFYGRVRGKCRWVQVNSGKETIRWNVTFAADNGWRKASVLWDDNPNEARRSVEKVYVLGPKASFCLSAGRDNSYLMTNVGSPDSQDPKLNLSKNLCNNAIFAPCGIWGHPLSELLADPSFQIVSAEETVSKSQKLIKINYNSDNADVKSGSIWTAPDNCWAIQKVDCQLLMFAGSAKHQLLCDVEYGVPQEGIPILHRVLYTVKSPGDDPVILRYEINQIAHGPTPEAEFTLPYYGLPEPAEPKHSRWYLWVIAAALACLAVAALCRRLAHRRSSRSAP